MRHAMDVDNAKYDDSATAVLNGRAGLFKGEQAVIHLGQRLIVGRSRMCEVSVARSAECLRLGKEALERHRSYRKISRRHFSVTYVAPDCLEIEDLSTNGTVVNGHRVDKILIEAFRTGAKTVVIEFGSGELSEVAPGGWAGKTASELLTEARDVSRLRDDVPSECGQTPVP